MSALWTRDGLVAATGGTLEADVDRDRRVHRHAAPSRRATCSSPCVGDVGDGHDHVAGALAKGAAAAMVHRRRHWRAAAAGGRHASPRCRPSASPGGRGLAGGCVAVTGSVGKTTTKEMLRAILMAHGPTSAALASLDNHWGLPLTLARLPADSAWAVVEIGMNHAGEILPLARMARPHVALVTEHRARPYRPSRLNGGDRRREGIHRRRAGAGRNRGAAGGQPLSGADARLSPLTRGPSAAPTVPTPGCCARDADAEGTDVELSLGRRRLSVRLAAPGAHMAMNATAAMLAAVTLGADPVRPPPRWRVSPPSQGGGRRRQSPSLVAPRSCSTRATTPPRPPCVPRCRCWRCSRPGAASSCSATCASSAMPGHPSMPASRRHRCRRATCCSPAARFRATPGRRCRPPSAASTHPIPLPSRPSWLRALRPATPVLVEGQSRQQDENRGRRLDAWPGGRCVMLINLAKFADQLILFNLFRYLTFRAGAACLTALVLSLMFGPALIRWLKSVQRGGQPIRLDGPERRLIEKKGTPTMGGVLILASLSASTLLWADLRNGYVWAVLLLTLGYGAIGFVDDYIKLSKASFKGLSGAGKLILQLVMGLAASAWIAWLTRSPLGTGVAIRSSRRC
jgi:hypothetical protein